MMKVNLYSLKVCPNCKILKQALTDHGIEFEEHDLEAPESKTKMLMHNVFTAVAPVLEIDGTYITYDTVFSGDSVNMTLIAGLLKDV
jgi:glutaredoxin